MFKRILSVFVLLAVVAVVFGNDVSFAGWKDKDSKSHDDGSSDDGSSDDKKSKKHKKNKKKDHKSYSNVNSDPVYKKQKKELTAIQKIEKVELNALHAKEKTELKAMHAKEMAIFEAEWKKGTIDIDAVKEDLQKKYDEKVSGSKGTGKEVEKSDGAYSDKSQSDVSDIVEETKEKARKWLEDKQNKEEAETKKEEPAKVESSGESSIDKARDKAKEWYENKKKEKEGS